MPPPPWIPGKDKSAPKGVAAVIVESNMPKQPQQAPMSEEKMLAGKEFISAIQASDAQRTIRAFETLYAICEMESHAAEEEEENDED